MCEQKDGKLDKVELKIQMIQQQIEQQQELYDICMQSITIINKRIMKQQLSLFIQSQYPQGTTNIDISSSYQLKIGPSGAEVLAELITWPIQQINLNMYFIESQGMQAIIKASRNWPTLKTMLLQKNSIGCEGLLNIHQANWPNLQKIILNKNGLKAKGFSYIAQANWPELRVLQLSHNEIGLEGAMHFPQTHWPNLKLLNLNYNLIGNQGLRQVSKCSWPNLYYLQLSNNKLDAKAMFYLAQMDLPSLTHLSLNRNQIGKDDRSLSEIGCYYLSRLRTKNMKSLHVFGNEITLNGMRQVIYSGKLAENCFLQIIRNLFTYDEIREDIDKLKLFCNVFY